MTAPRSFREAFTEDPADVKDRSEIVEQRDSARRWAAALEGQNAAALALADEMHRSCIPKLMHWSNLLAVALTGGPS